MDYWIVLFWSLVGSVFSLVGGLVLIGNKKMREIAVRFGLPFGAGALIAAGFLGLLPEAVEGLGVHSAVIYALGGFLGFFVLERLLGWFHHHESHHHDEVVGTKNNAAHQWLVIVGDTLHNAIDGVAIGAAFVVSPAAGIGAAIAVAAHEIPQEIGDFSILLGKGMRPFRVVLFSVISALATVVTALLTYALGTADWVNPAPLLAIAAGFFIYVAASDLIPDIHEKPRREGNVQSLLLLVGVVMIGWIISLTPHTHENDAHNHNNDSHEEHGDE